MNATESHQAADSPWIVIHDEQITPEDLVREVARRVEQRRAELGFVSLVSPTFGYASSYPDVPLDKQVSPHLFYYLGQANKTPPPSVEPVLAPSPTTRMPLVGGLWQKVRAESHNLVLFYVNKSVREQSQVNANLVSTLNELTRVIQEQQEEIDALRADIQRLEK